MHHYHLRRRGPLRALNYALSAREVGVLVDRFHPDAINAHFVSGYGFAAALANVRRRCPLVVHLWGSDIMVAARKTLMHAVKTAFALEEADFVFADSQYLLAEAARLAPLPRAQIVPWGVEERYLSHHKSNYTLGRPLRIIVPRLHEPIYNNPFIVRALAPLLERGQVEVTFPAFGSEYNSFRQEAATLVQSGLGFYQRLPRAEFLASFSQHDVYLSAAFSDSSPVSLIEAMALGLIPVAMDIPGVREWLTEESGFRFVHCDAGDLRSVIERLVSEGDPFEEMRRRNLERVRREALFEDNVARQIEIMKGLAAHRGAQQ